jgi:putative transposase
MHMRTQTVERSLATGANLLDQFFAGRPLRAVAVHEYDAPARLTPAQFARVKLRHPDIGERVLALHANGYGAAEIQSRVSMYAGEQIPAAFVRATLADLAAEAADWSSRPLEATYPIVVFERLRMRWRDHAGVQNRDCHIAIGFQAHGPKEVLGFWFEGNDAHSFWQSVLADLHDRGVDDIIYAVGLGAGGSAALTQVFPAAQAIAHVGELVRQSQDLSACKNRCTIAKALRPIHGARCESEARAQLERFEAGGNASIAAIWRRNWDKLGAFFAIAPEVRCVMTSTFAADGLRRGLKFALNRRKHTISDDEARTLMYLVTRSARRKWKRPQREWHAAKAQLALQFPDRFF